MKKIIVVLAVLFFASPVLAQDYQSSGLLQPYEIFQLDQSSQASQADQSIRYYQPYQFELQQAQPQPSKPKAAKRLHAHIGADLPDLPPDTK